MATKEVSPSRLWKE